MLKNETTVTVNRPPDEVFAILLDTTRWGEWMAGHIGAHQESGGPVGLGTQIRETFWIMPPIRGSAIYNVTAFEPGRRLTFTMTKSPAPGELWWALEPAVGGTRVTFGTQVRFGRLMRWMEPLLTNEGKRALEQQAQSLKRLVEGNI